MTTWREDRLTLKAKIREGLADNDDIIHFTGLRATMCFALVAQLRGKLHMKSYGLYGGGWRTTSVDADWPGLRLADLAPPAAVVKNYGDTCAAEYYQKAIIVDLADQARWINAMLRRYQNLATEFGELAERVLINAYAPEPKREVLIADYAVGC